MKKIDYLITEEIYELYKSKSPSPQLSIKRYSNHRCLDACTKHYYTNNKIKSSRISDPINLVCISTEDVVSVQKLPSATYTDIVSLYKKVQYIDPLVYTIILLNNTNKENDAKSKKFLEYHTEILGDMRYNNDYIEMDTELENLIINTQLANTIGRYFNLVPVIDKIKNTKNRVREFKKLLNSGINAYTEDDYFLRKILDFIESGVYKNKLPEKVLYSLHNSIPTTELETELIQRIFEIYLNNDHKDSNFPQFLLQFRENNLDLSRINKEEFLINHGVSISGVLGIIEAIPKAISGLVQSLNYAADGDRSLVQTIFTAIDLIDDKYYDIIVRDIASTIVSNKLRKFSSTLSIYKETALVKPDSTLFEDVSELVVQKIEELPVSKIESRVKYILSLNDNTDNNLLKILYNTMMNNLHKYPKLSKFVMINKI